MNVESLKSNLRRESTVQVTYVAAALVLLVAPFVIGQYYVGVLTEALIFGLLAVSVNLALGYAGLLTLAPAAFFGIGAYSVATTVVTYGQSFWLGIVVALVAAIVFSLAIGYAPIKQRISGVYFALFTMAFGVAVHDFTYASTNITGGSNGLGFVSLPTVAGVPLGDTLPFYYFTLFVTLLIIVGMAVVLNSDYGQILHAIRQNEQRMEYLGYNTDREKIIAWVSSCLISVLAGVLYVGTVNLASPSMMSFSVTGETLVWVVIGGLGSLLGPFVAAFALTIGETLLSSIWSEGYLLILGVLFVIFVFALPRGLAGLLKD